MKKSVICNYNYLLKTAGGAMPIFDRVKSCQERSGPR
jgi:hypothetical protein